MDTSAHVLTRRRGFGGGKKGTTILPAPAQTVGGKHTKLRLGSSLREKPTLQSPHTRAFCDAPSLSSFLSFFHCRPDSARALLWRRISSHWFQCRSARTSLCHATSADNKRERGTKGEAGGRRGVRGGGWCWWWRWGSGGGEMWLPWQPLSFL